jgi:hypothetical protein
MIISARKFTALSVFSAFQRAENTTCRIPMAQPLVFFYSANMRPGLHLIDKAEHKRPDHPTL